MSYLCVVFCQKPRVLRLRKPSLTEMGLPSFALRWSLLPLYQEGLCFHDSLSQGCCLVLPAHDEVDASCRLLPC